MGTCSVNIPQIVAPCGAILPLTVVHATAWYAPADSIATVTVLASTSKPCAPTTVRGRMAPHGATICGMLTLHVPVFVTRVGLALIATAVCAHVVMIRCPPATIQALMGCRRCKLTAQAVRMLEVASSLSTRTRMVSSGAPRTLRQPAGVQRDLLSLNLRLCPTV